MPFANQSDFGDTMVRFLEGTEGFSEYRPQDIGLKFAAFRALESLRVAMSMRGTEDGEDVFINALKAAELRFWAYLRNYPLYKQELMWQAEIKPKNFNQLIPDQWESVPRYKAAQIMAAEIKRIELMKAERRAYIIFIWADDAGLDLERQLIPETKVPDKIPEIYYEYNPDARPKPVTQPTKNDTSETSSIPSNRNDMGKTVQTQPELGGHDQR